MSRGLTRWEDPFSGISDLHSQLDDMFNSFFASPMPAIGSLPAMDVYTDDDKQMVAEVQIPGFDKNDIDVSVHDGVLEIKGEKTEKEEDKGKKRNYMVRESSASLYRRIALPKAADESKIDASFDKGLLKVTIPFKALPKPKKVSIKDSPKKK